MEAPNRGNASMPAVAAVGIIALIVLASIATYLLLSTR
jgi:hypothetical protein